MTKSLKNEAAKGRKKKKEEDLEEDQKRERKVDEYGTAIAAVLHLENFPADAAQRYGLCLLDKRLF